MNRKVRKLFIFTSSIILVLGVYGMMMYGLKDFNSTTGFMRVDQTGDDNRGDAGHQFIDSNTTTLRDIGRVVGFVLWEAKGVDIIIVGLLLLIASESAATIVKGMEDQCAEFRTEMCETDKFVILERKEVEEEEAE